MKTLKKGDQVSWNSPKGPREGKVLATITHTAHVKGHTAKATKADPQILVKSGKSGKVALHKPDALKKV